MAKIGKFEAFVVVDGKCLEEFPVGDQRDTASRVSRYVEAVDDAKFAVRLELPQKIFRDHDIPACSVFLRVDGNDVFNYIYYRDAISPYREISTRRTFKDGTWFAEDLKFVRTQIGECHTSSPEDIDVLKERASKLGVIQLDIFRLRKVQDYVEPMKNTPIPTSDNEPVAKKAIIGLTNSHRTGFGPKQEAPPPCRIVKPDHIDDTPYYRFEFRCLSRDLLQTLGVIPRTPSPGPVPPARIEEMSQQDLVAEVHRLRAAAAAQQEVKRENIEAEQANASRGTKRDLTPPDEDELAVTRARKIHRTSEIIDLTNV